MLETFLDFHVPSKGALYAKLKKVDFEDHKKIAIEAGAPLNLLLRTVVYVPCLTCVASRNARSVVERSE